MENMTVDKILCTKKSENFCSFFAKLSKKDAKLRGSKQFSNVSTAAWEIRIFKKHLTFEKKNLTLSVWRCEEIKPLVFSYKKLLRVEKLQQKPQ